MTILRERMSANMQLRGLAEKTQEAYLRAVRQLAAYCGKPPDQIDEEELRQYPPQQPGNSDTDGRNGQSELGWR